MANDVPTKESTSCTAVPGAAGTFRQYSSCSLSGATITYGTYSDSSCATLSGSLVTTSTCYPTGFNESQFIDCNAPVRFMSSIAV